MVDIIIILFLFLLNGLFAMCEIALVSSRRSRLKQAAKNGSNGAKIALKLSDEPEKFLSTVQIGITLVGIIAGAYGAEAFTADVQPWVARSAFLAPHSERIAFTLIITLITYFSLIIGELVPKTLALNNPERITIALAPFMRVLAFTTYPLVLFLTLSTKIVLKLFLIKQKKDNVITEEELKYLIDTGAKHGIIEKQEGEMLHSVFKFGDKKAGHMMIYRRNVKWLNVSQPKEDILNDIFQLPYSKYPVCDGSLDRIIGVVSVTDVLQHIQKPDFNIRQYLKDPVFFPEHIPALRILEEFRVKKVHIGFVVNEHGHTIGLITLHDLIENIVGELPDSENRDTPAILQRPDGSWLMSGKITMKEVRQILSVPPDAATSKYSLETFLKRQTRDHITLGEVIELPGYRLEIIDLDGSNIDKVLVTRNPNQSST
jgi:putative hemolysin